MGNQRVKLQRVLSMMVKIWMVLLRMSMLEPATIVSFYKCITKNAMKAITFDDFWSSCFKFTKWWTQNRPIIELLPKPQAALKMLRVYCCCCFMLRNATPVAMNRMCLDATSGVKVDGVDCCGWNKEDAMVASIVAAAAAAVDAASNKDWATVTD